MPDRRKGERRDDFVSRCMSSGEAKRDFPDDEQRLAFCMSRARKGADMTEENFEVRAEVVKIDDSLGLVMGHAIVCKVDGEPYFDLQGDHIPEDSMLKAALDFMEHSQVAGHMHERDDDGKAIKAGSVVFAFPLTDEIAKAFGIETRVTGLMIAMRPDEDMLKRFQLGELTGFSIGGLRLEDEEIEE